MWENYLTGVLDEALKVEEINQTNNETTELRSSELKKNLLWHMFQHNDLIQVTSEGVFINDELFPVADSIFECHHN